MVQKTTFSRKVFIVINSLFLVGFCLTCILPFINVLAISLSSSPAAGAGLVKLWPVDFNLISYGYVLTKPEFLRSCLVTVERIIIGVPINMILMIITAYPLSQDNRDFRLRTLYAWIFVFTTLFAGGLIPLYVVIKQVGLLDHLMALILPGALNIGSTVLLLNFFRNLPKEMKESAYMDGASHWTTMWKIVVPTSTAALATLLLFQIIGHWNDWFSGLVFINTSSRYPLQTYMQTLIIEQNSRIMTQAQAKLLRVISDRTVKSAQIFVGALPIMLVYPFLQKYFMKGIVVGSVKG